MSRESGSLYTRIAAQIVSVLLTVLVLNIVLGAVWWWHDREPSSELVERYGVDRLLAAYPGWSKEDLEVLLQESDTRGEYEPFTEFRPKNKRGRFVTVEAPGYRVVEGQHPWPPGNDVLTIFVFGGSTAFGTGLQNRDTIPSRIQARLSEMACAPPIAVYNFARPDYFSTQERILFENLLSAGHAPKIAVFIDGLNDFFHWQGTSGWSEGIRALLEHAKARGESGVAAFDFVRRTPFGRTANVISRWAGISTAGGPSKAENPPSPADRSALTEVIRRWLANKRLIEAAAREFEAGTLFVWQPVPTHEYALEFHNLSAGDSAYFGSHLRSHYGYALVDEMRASLDFGDELLWLDDIQRGRRENLYVDGVHYTAAFSDEIAGRIVTQLSKQPALSCSKSGQAD